MISNQNLASPEAPEVDLYPCPFCGNSALKGSKHKGDCFFQLSEELKTATGADAAYLAEAVSASWKRRYAPIGYKLVSESLDDDVLKRWASETDPQHMTVRCDPRSNYGTVSQAMIKNYVYPSLFKQLKSLYESPDSQTSDASDAKTAPIE